MLVISRKDGEGKFERGKVEQLAERQKRRFKKQNGGGVLSCRGFPAKEEER